MSAASRGGRRRRLALFGLDGTLLTGRPSERRFAAWLFGRRAIGWRQAPAWLAYLVRHAHRDGCDVLRRDKGYVAGLAPETLTSLSQAHVDEVLAGGALDPDTVAALERHRDAGDRLALLSGTLQPLAEAYAARLGVARADTIAYGDSYADRFVLDDAGEAVAVEPDRRLARLAAARGWRRLERRAEAARRSPAPRPTGFG